jgi:hypothetical protein
MHGSLFRRQTVVENRQFGFQSFWPVQSASAIYNCEFGELRVNAKTAREKELYCRLLGKHIFGNENLFPTGVMAFGAAVGSGHTQLGAWDHQIAGT